MPDVPKHQNIYFKLNFIFRMLSTGQLVAPTDGAEFKINHEAAETVLHSAAGSTVNGNVKWHVPNKPLRDTPSIHAKRYVGT